MPKPKPPRGKTQVVLSILRGATDFSSTNLIISGQFQMETRKHHSRLGGIAAIYVRVSRFDEKGNAVSPAMQEAVCRALTELQGLEVNVYADLNLSGKNTNRPQLQAMLREVDEGRVAVVAVYAPVAGRR